MSKQVHCPECQTENTPGSKFCNHCGARLPKSTSILCPRCQTPNPHNNFYCDNCGGRLHAEQNDVPPKEEPKPEASDLPTSAKMFSLPTRDPGDTGELDPGSLQNWLQNQGDDIEETENTGKLPRLSDLTPEERGKSDDLPGWLINTENEDLLSGSPEDITTEHFLHLIQDINEEEREKLSGLLNDPAIAGETANLPDWLKDVAQSGQPETPPPAEEPQSDSVGDMDDDSADWLFEPDTIEDDPSLPEAEAPSDEAVSSLEDADEVPDWLDELAPSRTAMLGKSAEDEQPSSEPELDGEDLPDWLAGDADTPEEPHESQTSEEILGDFTLDTAAATSLTGWLAEFDVEEEEDEATEAADVKEEKPAAWLNTDAATDTSLATGNTDSLPDWLDDLEPAAAETGSPIDTSELDSTLEALFGEKPKDATGELDWLEEVDEEPAAEPETDDSLLPSLVDAAGTATLAAVVSQDDADALEDDPDWLSKLAGFDPNEIVESVEVETAVSEPHPDKSEAEVEPDLFDVAAIIGATESADQDNFNIDSQLPVIDEQEAGDWVDIDGILAGTADDETLPDWLEQLDDIPDTEIEPFDTNDIPPEEIPAWVANMRPGDTGELASALPSALFTESNASELLNGTEDLADAGLPDWLDASIDERSATAEKDAAGWFDSDGDVADAPAELEAILADLPPTQAPEDMLQKAEIPNWLEELKPRELTGEAPPITESRLESSGPLAGMPNTIAIEPIVAMPRTASTPSSYAISPEQVQQAQLLRQLVQEAPSPPQVGQVTMSARSLAGLRILVALLLLAAVILGLYGPPLLKSKSPAGVPAPAAAMNTAVSDAAGQTVLFAFEYTPALAGELSPEAEMLLAQIDATGSPILTTSQYVAGTAVAETMTAPYDTLSLGLIPGEALGLRQLGGCLGENAPVANCTSLHNRTLNADTAAALADVGLVVVLTSERSSLINWVEQVGTSSDIPIVIGTTQSLAPVVTPYFATAQVAGYLNGLPATVAYQQAYTELHDTSGKIFYDAQSFILLVTAVILLIGGLLFGSKKKKA